MNAFTQDVRQAWRGMRRRPAFTLVIVLSLALGIGANTTIFSIVNTVLVRPLPYEDEDRLVRIRDLRIRPGRESRAINVSPINYSHLKEQAQAFVDVGAQTDQNFNLAGSEQPERVNGILSSHNVLDLLGLEPMLGRGFLPEEDLPDAPAKVVILGYELWARQFGSDPNVLDKTILLDDEAYTVIGVMPNYYTYPWDGDLWIPMGLNPQDEEINAYHFLHVIARLKPDVTPEGAQAELDTISNRLATEYPNSNTGWQIRAILLRDDLLEGDVEPKLLFALLGTSVFLLLIACANVTNMLLARSLEQGGEIAMRSALGASRSDLMRYLITQGLLLAVISGGVALLLALLTLRPIVAVSPVMDLDAMFHNVGLDLPVLGFTLGISLVVGCIFSLVPAFKVSRPDLQGLIKEGSRTTASRGGRRLLSSIVVVEIALSVILLIGTGLMLKSIRHLRQIDPGFDSENSLVMHLAMSTSKYPEERQRIALLREIVEAVESLPGVISAATTTTHPLDVARVATRLSVEDRPPENPGDVTYINHRLVTPGFFETMQIPILQGRGFTEQDREDTPMVVVVSKRLADAFWPGEDPINKRVKRGLYDSDAPWMTVVGLAGDVADRGEFEQTWYLPHAQHTFPARYACLVVLTATDPMSLVNGIRTKIHGIDPRQPIYDIASTDRMLAQRYGEERFTTFLVSIFTALGLALTVVGVYGILSYSVVQQTSEIGMRIALGAQRRDVLRHVLRQGMTLGIVGLVIGLAGAWTLTRLLSSWLYEVSPTDPGTFVFISLLSLVIVGLASYIPARKATTVEPAAVLRAQ